MEQMEVRITGRKCILVDRLRFSREDRPLAIYSSLRDISGIRRFRLQILIAQVEG